MTSGRVIRPQKTGNRQLDELQRSILDTLAVVLTGPFGSGKAIRGNKLVAATPLTILHGLGYAPRTVIPILVVGPSAGGIVVISLSSSSFTVKCSQSVTADFWVS